MDRVGILSGISITLLANTGLRKRHQGTTIFGRYGAYGKEDYMKMKGGSFGVESLLNNIYGCDANFHVLVPRTIFMMTII